MTSDDLPANVDPGVGVVLDNEPLDDEPVDNGSPTFPSLETHAVAEAVSVEAEPADPIPDLDLVLDIPIKLTVELGRADIAIREVVSVGRGSIIDLDGAPGAPLDVRANGVLIGRGEIVVIDEERLGLRLVELVSPAERVSRLR
jgi:flagellar motor switch protein FliN